MGWDAIADVLGYFALGAIAGLIIAILSLRYLIMSQIKKISAVLFILIGLSIFYTAVKKNQDKLENKTMIGSLEKEEVKGFLIFIT